MRASDWHCGLFDLDLSTPFIMGILNVTPDSFSDGGLHDGFEAAIEHAHALLASGADIIDIGGESTRPGAEEVDERTELARVLPVVRELAQGGVLVSIDTRHALVADACIEAGASIINDVSGFRDQAMRDVAARSDVGLVVMHMRGTPKTMQDDPSYEDVVLEVEEDLLHLVRRLEAEGVEPERICLDPGIGFGKDALHNHELVCATSHLADLGFPYMAAVSRKSYVGAMSGQSLPQERDHASALCAAYMASQGARIIRAHDVALTRRILDESRHAVIGLGSNMGNSYEHLDDALAELRMHPDIWLGAISEYVVSDPAYYEDQAPFVNAVADLQTTLSPHELLHVLQGIEERHGRVRSIENGPRVLDLDIVDYEGVVMESEELALPHPLALERDFVMAPLLSILPKHVFANGIEATREHVRVGRVRSIAGGILGRSGGNETK